jgi:hypothetical protein
MRTGKIKKYQGRVISAWQYVLNTGRHNRILTVDYDETTKRLQKLVITDQTGNKVIAYDPKESKYFLFIHQNGLQRFPLQEIRLNNHSGKLTWLREASNDNRKPVWEKCSTDEALMSYMQNSGWLMLSILLTSFVLAYAYVSHAQIFLAILPLLFAGVMAFEIEDREHECLVDKFEHLFGVYTIERNSPAEDLSSDTFKIVDDTWHNDLNALCEQIKKEHPSATSVQAKVSLIDNSVSKLVFTTQTSKYIDQKTSDTKAKLPKAQLANEKDLVEIFVEDQFYKVSGSDDFPLVELTLVISDPTVSSGGYVWHATAGAQLWGGGMVPYIATDGPFLFNFRRTNQ